MKASSRSLGGACTLIVLLTIMAYLPALRCGFIWDDDDHLTENPAVTSVDGLKQIWSSLAVSRYYPLTLTSFWVQRRLWGLNPLPYHAVNIALQAFNAMLLWRVLRRLQVRGAWVAAALWAVHPVNVETVAWVTELKNTQSGLFFLLALLLFLRFEDGLRLRDYVLAVVCGAAAMLSKPSTVVLPGVLLLCTWWRRGSWERRDLLRVAPLLAFAAGMSLVTIAEQYHHIEAGGASEWALTAAQRLMLAGRAVWFYAGKLLWPAGICFIYPRWELPVRSIVAWLPLAGAASVAAALWQFRRARWARAATFGFGYFVIALVPVLGFFDIYFFRYSFVADHFQYLAGMGLVALVVSAGAAIARQCGRRSRDVGVFASGVALLALGVSTWRQAHVYQNQETLWRDTLAKNPNTWMGRVGLGLELFQAGDVAGAIAEYRAALLIEPDNVDAHNDLGLALASQGKSSEAAAEYQEALRSNPAVAQTHANLGTILASQGKLDEAVAEYQLALQIDPSFAGAHNNLGNVLASQGKVSEAIAEYATALRIQPDYVKAHCNLGVALERAGRMQEAIQHYEQALRIQPDYSLARERLTRLRGTGRGR